MVRETGLSYKKLDRWVREGIVIASINAGTGSGMKRIFSEDDVRIAQILMAFSASGFRPGQLKKLSESLYKVSPTYWWGYCWLIVNDKQEVRFVYNRLLKPDDLTEQSCVLDLKSLNTFSWFCSR